MKLIYSYVILLGLFGLGAASACAQTQWVHAAPCLPVAPASAPRYVTVVPAQQCGHTVAVARERAPKPIGYQTVRISQKSKYPIGLLFYPEYRRQIVWGAGMPSSNIRTVIKKPIYN